MRTFADCLRSALVGSAPGPDGCSTQLLFLAAEGVARGTASEVSRSFLLATSKRDGGVREVEKA